MSTDIMFAVNNGFVSVLVLSGETDIEMAKASGIDIDVILPSIADWDK